MLKSTFLIPVTLVVGLAAAAACTGGSETDSLGKARSEANHDPGGNNGTVKIQEAGAPDEIPDNDPHVGCLFNIEFRGYDEGDLEATWTLEAHPPSGSPGTVITGPNVVAIGGDPAGGANDLDALVEVNMGNYDLSGLTAHPQQGYHIKLTVHAEGSKGADTKHKVFWVQGCQSTPDAGTSSSSSSSSSSSGGSSSGGSTSSSSGGSTSSSSSSSGGSSSSSSSGGQTW